MKKHLILSLLSLIYSSNASAVFNKPLKQDEPVKFYAFSDMNVNTRGDYNSATLKVVDQILQKQPGLILGLGDYIDGESKKLSSSTYNVMWNSFSKKVLAPMVEANVPFLPTPGNHDSYYTHERNHYSNFWKKNKANIGYVDDTKYPFYYSYTYNGIFFISLDDAKYYNLRNRTEQLKWIREQLDSDIARSARARVIYGHIPLYSVASKKKNSSTPYDNGALKGERTSTTNYGLESTILDMNVDLVVFGHSHAYYSGYYQFRDGRKVKVVSLPCAGGTKRYLLNSSIKSEHGFVEISLNANNEFSTKYINYKGELENTSRLPSSLNIDSRNKVKYIRE